MKLNFLGRGAAFNVKEGNTAAYFIENNELFLIDCGENIYERIINKNLLKGIEKIHIFITHMHPDHVGSLGTLIFHSYFMMKQPVNIVYDSHFDIYLDLQAFLEMVGVTTEMYNYVDADDYIHKYSTFDSMGYIQTKHCPEILSLSLWFNSSDGLLIYTGDFSDGEYLSNLIMTVGTSLDKLYVDATSTHYTGNVHLYIGILNNIIPEHLKNRVYCMHFNNDECIRLAKEYGFNVVEVV